MKSLIWGGASIAFVVVLCLALLLSKFDIADLMASMLSGSVVGLSLAIMALAKGVDPGRAAVIYFSGIAASALGYFFAAFLLGLFTINIYSTTALFFDLIVGTSGAIAVGLTIYNKYKLD